MDLHLHDKVAIVTGASKGIGRAIAETLAAEGMRVVAAARSQPLLESLTAGRADRWLVQAADLSQPHTPPAVVHAAIERFGRIDLLVNNAGATPRGDFLTLTDDEWNAGFALKFYGAMRLSRAAWPHLRTSAGCIVNIAGIGGRTGSAEFTIGGGVNASLMHLTKSLADRGVKDGVRVNAINPGSIETDRLQLRLKNFAAEHQVDLPEAGRQMAAAHGVARFGQPDEIARAVAFLASPAAAFVQGALIDIDGGQTRTL